jgi:hypothetical protein
VLEKQQTQALHAPVSFRQASILLMPMELLLELLLECSFAPPPSNY